MCKKHKKNFTVTGWDGMNKFLSAATAVTAIVFIILFILCFTGGVGTAKHGFILGMCGVFASLASAFFIAWIMRLYDLSHKKAQEEKALMLLQPYLAKIIATINDFFPQLRSFATIKADDTIQYTNDVVYYKDPGIKHPNRSFVDLNEEFREAHSKLERDLCDCLNSPMLFQCNEEVLTLLTRMKLNGLTRNLFEIYKASSGSFFSNTSFCSLYKNYYEFVDLYEDLGIISNARLVGQLKELGPKEKAQYILEIKTIRSQLTSKHKGRIYKGYDRIQ